ncbi:MAG: 23S rRNA (pseudouridine(1915)-N(3))-methyltransferase RlmH [Prevotellaceae bacterium]|nr:23S rRNA (pseudouridine(1915)-N(3))-methyltransferase RlmH [Prevotellaceae bacterium]
MKITFVQVGKTEDECFRQLVGIYERRLERYVSFETRFISNVRNAGRLSEWQLKEKEGAAILDCLQPLDYVVLLDEKGKIVSSQEFAGYIEKKTTQSIRSLVFVAGGAFGFSPAVYERANEKLSLSCMTFTHQMVRLVFTEQLYRAFSIIKHEPYHHG